LSFEFKFLPTQKQTNRSKWRKDRAGNDMRKREKNQEGK
jgi:hypothetical protein